MERGKLFFTISPARGGKSTFANKWVREKGERPRVIVCEDDIQLAMGHRYNQHVFGLAEAVQEIITKAHLIRGCDVLVDETHTTWKSINGILRIDPDAEPVWIVPREIIGKDSWERYQETLCQRAIDSGQPDLMKVIERQCMNILRLDFEFDDFFPSFQKVAREQKWPIIA